MIDSLFSDNIIQRLLLFHKTSFSQLLMLPRPCNPPIPCFQIRNQSPSNPKSNREKTT